MSIKKIVFSLSDHSCGYCSILPNVIRKYGWNPGKKIDRWFGDVLVKKTGNADITFSEVCICICEHVYERYRES